MRPPPHTVTPDDVRAAAFTLTRFREGYDQDEVDAFLPRVHEAVVAQHAGWSLRGLLTHEAVLEQRFAVTKYRPGYDRDEVDEFLDRVASTLRPDVGGPSPTLAPDLHPPPTGARARLVIALVLVVLTVVVLVLVL